MSAGRLDAAWLARMRAAGGPQGFSLPRYEPSAHGVGIVHLGVGAFHKAHQAVYTDDALARHGGDWRIAGISLRSSSAAESLDPQDGLYSLLVRDGLQTRTRVIGSLAHVIAAGDQPASARSALIQPGVKIVSMTVTEKAYGIDRATGAIQHAHPAVAHDLDHLSAPTGVLGLLVWAIRERLRLGRAPLTVLCCDNLPGNGTLVRAAVRDFADQVEHGLGNWIADHVAFPCTMVDRITPAPTPTTAADAARILGCEDQAAVETEPFSMWVVEDDFPAGRPAWEAEGAILVDDVRPYEQMKLRVLNGAHSMLAYAGHVIGYRYVRDVMADHRLAAAVDVYMQGAIRTLKPVSGIDFAEYALALQRRFANPAIAHETYQIAMDGTEKLPQRILDSARAALEGGQDLRPFAFAVAAWMRYCQGVTEGGQRYALRDPREDEIQDAVRRSDGSARSLAMALMALPALFPPELVSAPAWQREVVGVLETMLTGGVASALPRLPS